MNFFDRVLIAGGCILIYWIGSLDLVESYRNAVGIQEFIWITDKIVQAALFYSNVKVCTSLA